MQSHWIWKHALWMMDFPSWSGSLGLPGKHHFINCKVWREDYSVDYSQVGLIVLDININILSKVKFPTLWEQFEYGPFSSVYKLNSIETRRSYFGEEEFVWFSKPGLLIQQQHLTSQIFFWKNDHKFQ